MRPMAAERAMPQRSRFTTNEGWAIGLLAVAFVVRGSVASARHLAFDEAYYLCAARNGFLPWSIPDHPPLLGILLATADRLPFRSVELRVRLLPMILQAITALGIGRLAARLSAPTEARTAWAFGVFLGTWGLAATAGGLLATPDAPLLAALSWLMTMQVEPHRATAPTLRKLDVQAVQTDLPRARNVHLHNCNAWSDVAAGILAALAVLSKVVALLFVGALAPLPFLFPSLLVQSSHILGRGSAVSAPHLGSIPAMLTLVGGQVLLWTPPLLWVAARVPNHPLRRQNGIVLGAILLGVSVVASALVSGRPPEPNWLAPAAIPVLAVAAVGLAGRGHRARVIVLLTYATPTMLALGLWLAPFDLGPLRRVPHGPPPTAAGDIPEYARGAWTCIYGKDNAKYP
ncbi:MAG: hypothetical protein NVS3B20_20990 [Polyangiales bacterium]